MNFISPALTTATEAAGANIKGQQEGGALYRQILGQQAAMDEKRAQTQKAQADAYLAQRHANVPMMGDGNYNDAIRTKSGAEEGGKTPELVNREKLIAPVKNDAAVDLANRISPITTNTAVNTERRVAPIRTQAAINTAAGEAPIKTQQEIDAARGKAEFGPLTAAVDPETGLPRFYTRSEAHGMNKPQAAGAGAGKPTSAQGALALQRLGMSLADVQQAHERMTRMENDPEFRKKLTIANEAKSNAADIKPDIHASGLMGAMNNIGGSLVSGLAKKSLANGDADLNTYRRDKETVGTALTEVLPRPNQQLLQIEKGLSGIDVGWNPTLMAATQGRRAKGVEQLQKALTALEGHPQAGPAAHLAPPTAPSAASPLRQKYEAAVAHLKATGRTAEIPNLPVPPED